MDHFHPKKRHRTRCFAVQALYQWQLTDNDIDEILLRFLGEMNAKKNDTEYFRQLLRSISRMRDDLDTLFIPHLDRPIAELGPVELAILRLSTYEMSACLELPYRVVINEAVELAKTFAAAEAYKYINAVMDKVALQLRYPEVKLANQHG